MEVQEILTIVMLILPWIIAVGFCIYSFYMKYKKLPQTIEEWQAAFNDVADVKNKVEKTLKEVKSFFDPEKPMYETSLDTIKKEIPASSYTMTADALDRVLKTCSDEQERIRISDQIYYMEHPILEGEECCIYDLETSGAIFKVQYGVPELVTNKVPEYKHLTQKDISEIIDLLGEQNTFIVMSDIMRHERDKDIEYQLKTELGTVTVKNGEFRVLTSE